MIMMIRLNERYEGGDSVLHIAILKKLWKPFDELLSKDANPNLPG